jgi:hypothetical protein
MQSRPLSAGVVFWLLALAGSSLQAERKELKTEVFLVQRELVLPASQEAVFDAVTGDIRSWWDHSFLLGASRRNSSSSQSPAAASREIRNDRGDGVLHATVTYCERGKTVRFGGPLGFSGQAVDVVTTYQFLPDPAGTKLRLTCNVPVKWKRASEKSSIRSGSIFCSSGSSPISNPGRTSERLPDRALSLPLFSRRLVRCVPNL